MGGAVHPLGFSSRPNPLGLTSCVTAGRYRSIMHGWSFTDLAVVVLGALGTLKMLATVGLPELKETLAAIFDFIDWLRHRKRGDRGSKRPRRRWNGLL